MSPPAATSGSDAPAPTSVPFSYAQAAKGRLSTSSSQASSATAPTTQVKKEQARWADDSSDTPTAVEERRQSDLANGSTSKDTETSKSTTSSSQPPESNVSASHPPSPHYDSSATTAKEDDINSPAKISSEAPWTQKPPSQNGDQNHEQASDGARSSSQDNSSESTNAQPTTQQMKEAPVPAVNFWTKRAEEAKARQTQAKSVQPLLSSPQPGAPSQAAPPQIDKGGTANDPPPNSHKKSKPVDQPSSVKEPQENSSYPTNKTRGAKNGRNNQKQDPVQPKSAPLPPVRDESAWPTPLIAQDEDRRKAQDKTDKDRPISTNAKPHGKNEWVQIPYTPSVKFNTPLPPTRGRGGRGASRGGRGASFSERGAGSGATSTSKEDNPTGSENRGRSDGSISKSTNHSPADSRATSANQANVIDKSSLTNGQGKRTSYQGSQGPIANHQSGQQSRNQSVSPSEPNGTTHTATSRNETLVQQKGKQTSATSESAPRRRSSAVPYENNVAGTQPIRPKRRSPSGIDPVENLPDDTWRTVSDSLPVTQRNTPADFRPAQSNRYSDSGRDTWGSLPFRDNRSERGRGRGGRGNAFSLSQPTGSQPQNNANLPPLQTANTFTPKSASYQTQTFSQSGQSFSDFRSGRSGPRSASIPSDIPYQRFGQAYPATAQFPVYPAYYNTMYDYNAAPMSAIPYTPQMDQALLIQGIAFQLNYYFSLENLLKDMFLRKHMDSQGFVLLSFIANFKRMKDLTTDLDLIQFASSQSPELELRNGEDGQPKIRRKEDWDKWLLSMEERDPSAQNEGPPPQRDSVNNMSSLPGFNTQQGARSPFPEMHQANFDSSVAAFGMTPSFQPVPISSPVDGSQSPRDLSARHSLPALGTESLQSQYASPELSSNGQIEYGQEEVDSFPNDQIPFLTVAVRPFVSSATKQQPKTEASRSFSNGSISMEELKSTDESQAKSQTSNDDQAETDPLQKVLNVRKRTPTPSQSNTRQNDSVELFWFKGEESRQQPLPSNGNSELYVQLHYKALDERQHAESGKCPHDMDVLYQFWSHFLIRNFNTTMYNEFRQLAHDDAVQELSDVGLQSLITFYSEALSSQQPIRDRVARHYVSLVKNEDPKKGRPAFEQLRAAWRNGALNMKNRKRISTYIDQELRDELDK